MGNVLCLLIGFLIPIVVLALLAGRGLRPLAAASAYRNFAWRYGLESDTRGTSVRGHLEGRRLFIGEVVGDHRRPEVVALLDLRASLGLGLSVRTRGGGRIRRRLRRGRAPTLGTGDAPLDAVVEVRAFDAPRTAQVLVPDVRAVLLKLHQHAATVEVTDLWVRLRLHRAPSSEAALRHLVDLLYEAVAALEAARAAAGPPDALQHACAPWTGLAGSLGLTFDPAWPLLHGALGPHRVLVAPVREEASFTADVDVRRTPGPPRGLVVRPHDAEESTTPPTASTPGATFEAAFVIQGWDPGEVQRLVDADVRSHLLTLAAEGDVEVTDEAVTVRGVPLDVPRLESVIRTAAAVAVALDRDHPVGVPSSDAGASSGSGT